MKVIDLMNDDERENLLPACYTELREVTVEDLIEPDDLLEFCNGPYQRILMRKFCKRIVKPNKEIHHAVKKPPKHLISGDTLVLDFFWDALGVFTIKYHIENTLTPIERQSIRMISLRGNNFNIDHLRQVNGHFVLYSNPLGVRFGMDLSHDAISRHCDLRVQKILKVFLSKQHILFLCLVGSPLATKDFILSLSEDEIKKVIWIPYTALLQGNYRGDIVERHLKYYQRDYDYFNGGIDYSDSEE